MTVGVWPWDNQAFQAELVKAFRTGGRAYEKTIKVPRAVVKASCAGGNVEPSWDRAGSVLFCFPHPC